MSTTAINKNSADSINNDCSKFKAIATEIASMGASVGIKIIPFHNSNLEHFSNLNSEARFNILNSLQIYLNVYKAVQAEGSSLLDSIRVVWNALSQLGYRPTSDLFTYIKSGNVIEIHNSSLVQVFRNLNFFKFCSYSLEELYCYQMPELYTRDISFEEQLLTYVKQIYASEVRSVIKPELKTHTISELKSQDRLNISDDIHYIAPLFSQEGRPVATLAIESPRIEASKTITEKLIDNVVVFKPLASSINSAST